MGKLFEVSLLAALVATAIPAAAQRTTGTISGTVRDESGGGLPGVRVTLRSDAAMGTPTTATNEHGSYRFLGLAPGTYRVEFSLSGFKTVARDGIRVSVGATSDLDPLLALNNLAEEVTVTGSAEAVDTNSSEVGATFDRTWVANAPLSRSSFYDIVGGAPGVLNPAENYGGSQSFGSSYDENLYQLDGVDITDNFFSQNSVEPNVDAIEEVQVLALGAPAEYGNLTGAVVNIVTRQGGNAFHGDLSYFNQPPGLTGRNTDEERDDGFPFVRKEYHDVTAQLGGPIVKDKLWFFGSFQYQRDYAIDTLTDPATVGPAPSVNRWLGKLSWDVTPRHRLVASFHLDDTYWPYAPYVGGEPTSASVYRMKNPTPGLAYTGTLSPHTTLDVRYGGFYGSRSLFPTDPNQPLDLPAGQDLDTGLYEGGPFFWYDLGLNRTTLSAKLSHFADDFLGGSHDFRFGVQYSSAKAAGVYGYADVILRYSTSNGTYAYGYDHTPFSYSGDTRGIGAYVDDTFKPSTRLTISAGLRFDRNRAFSAAQDELDSVGNPTGVTFPRVDYYTWNALSPRLGFNFQLTRDGRTALKAHWGRYHRGITTAEYANVIGPSIAPIYFGSYDLETGAFYDTALLSSVDNLGIDPQYKSPYTDQLIVSLEREIAHDVAVSLTYAHKRGRNSAAWRDLGGIYAPVQYVDDLGAEASGKTIALQQLQNGLDELSYQITNRSEMHTEANAATLAVVKRMSGNWQLNASLTWLRASGRLPGSNFGAYAAQGGGLQFNPFGQDPNDFVNTDGRLVGDVPWQFKVQGIYKLPWAFLAGVNYRYRSGANLVRLLRVGDLTNLPTQIVAQPRGTSGRLPDGHMLDLRLARDFKLGRGVSLGLSVDVFNTLNADYHEYVRDSLGTSENYNRPYGAVRPRRAMLGAHLKF